MTDIDFEFLELLWCFHETMVFQYTDSERARIAESIVQRLRQPSGLPALPDGDSLVSFLAGPEELLPALVVALDAGCDPDGPVRGRSDALTTAIWKQNVEAVRLLLDRGADPNAVDSSERRVLSAACGRAIMSADATAEARSVEIVGLLLEAGADPALCRKDWRRKADMATRLTIDDATDVVSSEVVPALAELLGIRTTTRRRKYRLVEDPSLSGVSGNSPSERFLGFHAVDPTWQIMLVRAGVDGTDEELGKLGFSITGESGAVGDALCVVFRGTIVLIFVMQVYVSSVGDLQERPELVQRIVEAVGSRGAFVFEGHSTSGMALGGLGVTQGRREPRTSDGEILSELARLGLEVPLISLEDGAEAGTPSFCIDPRDLADVSTVRFVSYRGRRAEAPSP